MTLNPYEGLPKRAFWKTGVAQEDPFIVKGIYDKKFEIAAATRIATAGSCFAQHITNHLRNNGYNVLDVELPPPGLSQKLHHKFGYSMYSARYGNIYTVRQLLQLTKEVAGDYVPQNYVWERNGTYYDALRPAIEPEGFGSAEEVVECRKYHLARVKELFLSLDLFIFTLGLTEMWVHKESGTVYPTAPGTLIGSYDSSIYAFENAKHTDIMHDFEEFQQVLKRLRHGTPVKILLTVSPVPLTATANGRHVLVASSYSKSTLRSIAGELSDKNSHIAYFPSYEIVNNPRMHSSFFSSNLRTVRDQAVETVMKHFFKEHPKISNNAHQDDSIVSASLDDLICEEALMEAFAK